MSDAGDRALVYAVEEHFSRLEAEIEAARGARRRWNRVAGLFAVAVVAGAVGDDLAPGSGLDTLGGASVGALLFFAILGQSSDARARRLELEREETRLPVARPGDQPKTEALEALAAALPMRRSLTMARARLSRATLAAVVLGALGLAALTLFAFLASDFVAARFAEGRGSAEVNWVIYEAMGAGVIGAVLAAWALVRRAEARSVSRDVERLEVEAELLRQGGGLAAARARKLFLLNEQNLRKYYDANRANARLALGVAAGCIVAGLALTVWTISLVIEAAGDPARSEALVAGVGAASAVMVNVVAAIVLRVHTSISSNVNAFHERLVRTHEAFLANVMATEIEDMARRDAAYAAVAAVLGRGGGAAAAPAAKESG